MNINKSPRDLGVLQLRVFLGIGVVGFYEPFVGVFGVCGVSDY